MASFENIFSHSIHIGCCSLYSMWCWNKSISSIQHYNYLHFLCCLLCCDHILFWNKNYNFIMAKSAPHYL